MEELFKRRPLTIAFLIGGFLLAAWITGSFWLGVVGAAAGAFVGGLLDRNQDRRRP